VKDVDTLSQDWELTHEERIDLYLQCASALDKENDPTGAFKVYYAAFKLIEYHKSDSNKFKS